jgi:solute carrier family 25 phosphate transporter 23/24/25/41
MKLPGQDTMTALSPERADRLRRLYEEELVRRCNEERPQARLWGGPDEQGEKNIGGKGVRFEAFRWVHDYPTIIGLGMWRLREGRDGRAGAGRQSGAIEDLDMDESRTGRELRSQGAGLASAVHSCPTSCPLVY